MKDENITNASLLFGGDVTGTGRTYDLVKKGDYDSLWGNTRDLVKKHDYAICNLESPLIENGTPIEKIGPNINGPRELARFIKEWGFNAVGLANNHIFDFGDEGVMSTIQACDECGLDWMGAEKNLELAERAHRIEINNIKISVIAVCEEEFCIADEKSAGAAPMRSIRIFYRIKSEKEWADHVIVYFHGGNEHYALPRPGLQDECRFYIDAGSSAVIGCHAHVLGSYEIYKGSPIVYSLGNLLFDTAAAGCVDEQANAWSEGYLLTLKISKEAVIGFEFHFYEQFSSKIGIVMSNKSKSGEARQRLTLLRAETENRESLVSRWNTFSIECVKVVAPLFNISNSRILRKIIYLLIKKRMFPTRKWKLSVLNRVRCASHHELTINHLKNYYK